MLSWVGHKIFRFILRKVFDFYRMLKYLKSKFCVCRTLLDSKTWNLGNPGINLLLDFTSIQCDLLDMITHFFSCKNG